MREHLAPAPTERAQIYIYRYARARESPVNFAGEFSTFFFGEAIYSGGVGVLYEKSVGEIISDSRKQLEQLEELGYSSYHAARNYTSYVERAKKRRRIFSQSIRTGIARSIEPRASFFISS